jgi:hypothetical protein
MAATSISTPGEALPGIPIGPRLRCDQVGRNVRELERRFKPAPRDMRELAQLKEFLKITPITERDGRAMKRSTASNHTERVCGSSTWLTATISRAQSRVTIERNTHDDETEDTQSTGGRTCRAIPCSRRRF